MIFEILVIYLQLLCVVATIMIIKEIMMESKLEHIPVLAVECIDALQVKANGCYIDATFGRGGHSRILLDHLDDQGRLIAFDQDKQAILHGQKMFEGDSRFVLIHDNFANLSDALEHRGLIGSVDGVLMDVGVSSPQLDQADRGFSFMRDGPLDMRMNQGGGQTAYEYLCSVSEKELVYALEVYGEERHARKVAKAIITARGDKKLKNSTLSLVDILLSAGLKRDGKKHAATRCFQAIRIAVNHELEVLEKGIVAALSCVKIGGRVAVISFHGLEHRIVKACIRQYRQKDGDLVIKQIGKAQGVSWFEQKNNPRARSAYLRVMERIK